MAAKEDIVIKFGPQGKFHLNIPVADIEAVEITARSFIEAGMTMWLYAQEKTSPDTPVDPQKLFDWMDKSVAIPA